MSETIDNSAPLSRRSEGLFGLPLGGEPVARQLGAFYRAIVQSRGGTVEWTPQTVSAVRMVSDWLAQAPGTRRPGLMVSGPFGGGKTTLVQAALCLLMHRAPRLAPEGMLDPFGDPIAAPLSRRAVYQTARSLYSDPRFDPEGSEWYHRSAFAECRDAALCVLDDVGQEATAFKKWGNAYPLVSEVILQRYEAGLPLVISSNLAIEQVAEKYGGFIADRLFEMCVFVRIEQRSFREYKARM